jgi:hypothetical protein
LACQVEPSTIRELEGRKFGPVGLRGIVLNLDKRWYDRSVDRAPAHNPDKMKPLDGFFFKLIKLIGSSLEKSQR